MRRFLLASVATAGLTLAALPALAQTQGPTPVPATPPITTPQPEAEVTAEEEMGTSVQSPDAAATVAGQASQAAQTSPQGVTAQTGVTGEAEVQAQTPPVAPTTEQAQATTPSATADATTASPAPNATASADTAIATPASASEVCAMRTTSVHFGRGGALSRENRHAIEHAADAASVCNLQQVAIVDSAQGATHSRRTSAIRAALVRQGVPQERITVEEAGADADASGTGRVDIRMNFAGVATGNTAVADATPATGANAAATPALRTTMTPVPAPSAAPAATPEAAPAPTPDATPATPEATPPEPTDDDPTTPGT